jgi:peptide/nickel transport system substrate-binding protein
MEKREMKHKLLIVVILIVQTSMILTACSPTSGSAAGPAQATNPPVTSTTTIPTTGVNEPSATAPAVSGAPTQATQSNRLGGWLDKIIFSAVPDQSTAVAELQAGTIDMYASGVDNSDLFNKVKADPNLSYATTYGSFNQLLLNTVQCTNQSLLNPFVDMKIREAMNWAIDRNYIAQEIFGGLAVPKYTVLSSAFPDYARYADVISAIETKYAYNLDKAKQVVQTEMPTLGATMGSDGKWQYKGNPVTLIGLIRTEDKRLEVGNYFANQLESLGFTVNREEKNSSDAAPIWEGDPKECKFNYYTAGWLSPAISRDDGGLFAQYNTGQVQQIPLFADFQPSAELKTAEDALFNNTFKTLDERAALFKTALTLSMQESWWGVFVDDTISFSPYKKTVSSAYDLASGFQSAQLFPYTVRLAGQEGGQIKIAQPSILVQPWNPIGGSNWITDAMVQHLTEDFGAVSDPYTGLAIPKLIQKADVVAQTGLPINPPQSNWVTLKYQDQIQVPPDAWADWDPVKQQFITVGEKYPNGITAKTESTVVYVPNLWQTTWHDGTNLSLADFVMEMILTFDPGKKGSKIYDPTLAPGVDSLLSHFKGVRITSTDPLTIETYDDSFALDAEDNVSDWYPSRYIPGGAFFGSIPWHDITPAIMAVADGKLAFTTDQAQANKVEWLSLIAGPSLPIQAQYLDQAITQKYIPYAPTLSKYITPDEAVASYTNLKNWYTAKKHLFIGSGPYYVDQVFPVEGTITVARYDKYLFPADQFSVYSEPKLISAQVNGPISVQSGMDASFDVTVNFKDQPYPASDIDQVRYLLLNSSGESAASGKATFVSDGQYTVDLSKDVTGNLDAGTYKLSVIVTSKVVSIPSIVSAQFVVTK